MSSVSSGPSTTGAVGGVLSGGGRRSGDGVDADVAGVVARIAASGQGGVLVRVDPEESDVLRKRKGVSVMEMRGRQMTGWLRVDADAVRTKQQLSTWVDRGLAFARSLPPKR